MINTVIYLLVFVLELQDLFPEVYLGTQAIVFLFQDRLGPVDINPINSDIQIILIIIIINVKNRIAEHIYL